MSRDEEAIMALGMLLVGIAILLIVGLVVFLIYMLIVSAAAYGRYKYFKKEGAKRFDEVSQSLGYDIEGDDVLTAMGYDFPFDGQEREWVDAILGTEVA